MLAATLITGTLLAPTPASQADAPQAPAAELSVAADGSGDRVGPGAYAERVTIEAVEARQ